MRATVLQYSINLSTPKNSRTKPEQEQIWNGFKMMYLSAEGRRENFDEECQACPDGNSSNNLVSDWCEPNSATEDSEAASKTKESRSKTIHAKSGGGTGESTKSFIILVGLAAHTIILYALRSVYVHRKESKDSIKYSIWMDPVWRLPLTLWSISQKMYFL